MKLCAYCITDLITLNAMHRGRIDRHDGSGRVEADSMTLHKDIEDGATCYDLTGRSLPMQSVTEIHGVPVCAAHVEHHMINGKR